VNALTAKVMINVKHQVLSALAVLRAIPQTVHAAVRKLVPLMQAEMHLGQLVPRTQIHREAYVNAILLQEATSVY
jgi:hypothetical protein